MPLNVITIPCPRCRVLARMRYVSGTGSYLCERCEWLLTVTAGGASTTLNGLTSIGATSVTLTSAAAFVQGTAIRIDTAGTFEDVTATTIAGNVVSFPSSPLKVGHANGATVTALSAVNALTGVRTVPALSPYLSGG